MGVRAEILQEALLFFVPVTFVVGGNRGPCVGRADQFCGKLRYPRDP